MNFALTNQGFDIDRLSREKDAVETRLNKLLTEEEEMNGVLAHQLTVQEGQIEALAGQIENQKRESTGAQYKAALERQKLTNELTVARGEVDSARRHNEVLADELQDSQVKAKSLQDRITTLETQKAQGEADAARREVSIVCYLWLTLPRLPVCV